MFTSALCVSVCVQATEVFSRARRYNEKVDMFSLTVMISEIITSYMVPAPRQYLADEVIDMVDAAIAFLEPLCPAMVPLLRAGFSDVPTERPSAVDMLTVLNSAEVIVALAAAAPVAPAAAAAVRVLACSASIISALILLYRYLQAAGGPGPRAVATAAQPAVVRHICA